MLRELIVDLDKLFWCASKTIFKDARNMRPMQLFICVMWRWFRWMLQRSGIYKDTTARYAAVIFNFVQRRAVYADRLPNRCTKLLLLLLLVLLLLHPKRLRTILSSACALGGRHTSSSRDAPRSSPWRSASKTRQLRRKWPKLSWR